MYKLSDNIERKFIESIDISDWEIETDTGWVDITTIHKTIPYEKWKLVTESGLELVCADTHIVFLDNFQEVFVKDLIPNKSKILTKNGLELVVSVENLKDYDNMYDISIDSDNHRFYTNGILSHNTTVAVAFLLWLSLFNDKYSIAILANKGSLARIILDRYQTSYENLPLWLQQGVIIWNKGNIELENGSRIIASATSSSAVRGDTYNCIFMDEVAHISNGIVEDFFTSVYPTITSGKSSKMIMVSTPKGLNMFYKMWCDALNKKNNFIPYEAHWYDVPGRDDKWAEDTIKNIGVHKWEQEFLCQFHGSTNTLISGTKLQSLPFKDPIKTYSDIDIFEEPIKESINEKGEQVTIDHLYMITCDISEGTNLDYSAFTVFDVSEIPYRVVAKYRSNNISPLLLPSMLKIAGEYYNNAYILCEINNNPQVPYTLHVDLEYENVLKVGTGNKNPQRLGGYGNKSDYYGVKQTATTKRMGTTTLKSLVESDSLLIPDFDIISELTTFVNNGPSFSAEQGCNDDLAMTLCIFAWASSQQYFKDLTNNDIRKNLALRNQLQSEIEDLPEVVGYNEILDECEIIDNDIWVTTKSSHVYGDIFKKFFTF